MTLTTRRLAAAGAIVAALVSALLFAPTVGSRPLGTAQAANLSLFDPGNIISDAVFYDSTSMDVATIQNFLNLKGVNCAAGEMPCLKDFRQNTVNQAGDAYCAPYQGAAGETAAAIIAKAGVACGINPRVLLVLLQKEQGLVTRTQPTAYAYTNATGFACPDTSKCDPAFSGFVSQVYFAARQFQRYRAGAVGSYRAGQWNTIGYAPATTQYNNLNNARCGTASVFIVNKATAGLYDYTPYLPNQAALAAGYGTGDSCSSYGNRNFYNYFTDWFGSTGFRVSGAIDTYYINQGGGTGRLGGPLDEAYCNLRGGGCGQDFQGGAVYWSPATGAFTIGGEIQKEWNRQGSETGPMGYPGAEVFCGLSSGGCGQWFQGGAIYWTPATGAHLMGGEILKVWVAQGYEVGPLGYPVGDPQCSLVGGGCSQAFQSGSIYWSPGTGAHLVAGDIGRSYVAAGAQDSAVGYPTGDVDCTMVNGGCHQAFANGAASWTSATGAHLVSGPINAAWSTLGAEAGTLGYPTWDMACGLTTGGCAQAFQGGFVYWSSAGGAHAIQGGIGSTWRAAGADQGPLGYPVGDQTCVNGGCSQSFQHGQLTWTSTAGVRSLGGAMSIVWSAQGGGNGALGYPTADIDCTLVNGGCRQTFEHGNIYWSSKTGAYVVSAPIADAWTARGAETGTLGYPTGAQVCTATNACSQPFQNGQLAGTSTTGVHWLGGAMSIVWSAQGAGNGALGYPTAEIDCTLVNGGCEQTFEHGTIVWSAATGAYSTGGGIGLVWDQQGGASGPLGYPTGPIACGLVNGGCRQSFQGGTIAWSPATGAYWTGGGIGTVWGNLHGQDGSLGYPTGALTCVNGGCYQQFQGGLLAWTAARGVIMVSGGIGATWGGQGAGGGALGYPTGPISCALVNGGCVQKFDGGSVYWQQAVGSHVISGPIGTSWMGQGAERGRLGYPTSDVYPVTGGQRQDFQGGSLTLDTTSGVVSAS